MKPLEAMAQGKLVLASDIGGHRELIRQGENGILFPRTGRRRSSRRWIGCWRIARLGKKIAAAARAYVERERSWRNNVARYIGIYTAAIERHGRLRQGRD